MKRIPLAWKGRVARRCRTTSVSTSQRISCVPAEAQPAGGPDLGSRRGSARAGVGGLGCLALEAEHDGLDRAVAVAGGAERAEQLGPDPPDALEQAVGAQALREGVRGPHRSHGVRAGRADAHGEEVERADGHRRTVCQVVSTPAGLRRGRRYGTLRSAPAVAAAGSVGRVSAQPAQGELPGMPAPLYAASPSKLLAFLDCPRRYRLQYLDRPAPQSAAASGRTPRSATRCTTRCATGGTCPSARPRRGRARRPVVDRRRLPRRRAVEAVAGADARGGGGIPAVASTRHPAGRHRAHGRRSSAATCGSPDGSTGSTTATASSSSSTTRPRGCPRPTTTRAPRWPLALYAAAVWKMFRRRTLRVELHHVPTGTRGGARAHLPSRSPARSSRPARSPETPGGPTSTSRSRGEASELFPPRPGPLCGWCDLRAHCPEGQAAGPGEVRLGGARGPALRDDHRGRGRRPALSRKAPRVWQARGMEQRVSFVTLAVRDLERSRAFYVEGLGLGARARRARRGADVRGRRAPRALALGPRGLRGRGRLPGARAATASSR